ncbi:hypothetical protein K469DRAFT_682123 [Zopfia rhizophila CBS 207.26]|uniref:Homeodomain-like protein n=1 Tax=Zopfia rhizophila CBS 207.26 TaxID=1314779 RepID=A0A6A6F180_9PEZI|nr:hypothetical protein K469DRAFT_682123 [Zopfia rhizophila CBS 207.26]
MDHQWGDRGTGRRNAAKRWTAEEDATLRELVMGSGIEFPFISVWSQFLLTVANVGEEAISWVDVSRHLSGRTNKDSRRRWTKIKDNFNRGIWSRDEDESLRVAVERFGQRWALVTEVVETRSPDQCQKRWRNALDPKISGTVSWSSEEDQLLRAAVSEMGKNWSQISDRYFPNRSPLSLSNRYTSFEQHSKNSTPPAGEPQPLNSSAVEKNPKSPPAQNNASVTDSSARFPEASNALIAPSWADVIDHSHFDEALEGSDLQFTWQDVPCDFVDDSMLAPNLDPTSRVDTTLPQEYVPYLVNSPSSNAPTLPTDVQMTAPSISTIRCQEVDLLPPNMSQASSCVPPHQPPSGAASSVLVLENLDDETRDAVLRLIWSKTRCTTLRLE